MGHCGMGAGEAGEASENTRLLKSDFLCTASHWPWESIRMTTDLLMSPTVLRCSGYCSAAHCLSQCLHPACHGYCSILQSSSWLHVECKPRGRMVLHLTDAQRHCHLPSRSHGAQADKQLIHTHEEGSPMYLCYILLM